MTDARAIIIMPAHNEAANLPSVFADLRRHAPDLDVVVVDDASSDETTAIAAQLGAVVVTLPCNLGYGGAVQTGFKYAVENGYDYAVMMDADGQHDPEFIPSLLAPVVAGEADVAIGSRFLGVMDYEAGWAKRAGMAIFGAIAAHFTGRRVTDPTSGFQALNRKALRFFARDNYPSDSIPTRIRCCCCTMRVFASSRCLCGFEAAWQGLRCIAVGRSFTMLSRCSCRQGLRCIAVGKSFTMLSRCSCRFLWSCSDKRRMTITIVPQISTRAATMSSNGISR